MEDLIRQILILSPVDRRKIVDIINASLNDLGEGYFYAFEDFSQEQKDIIKKRLTDIELEKDCLIEFDDHLLTIK
jgi:hypothetical protein